MKAPKRNPRISLTLYPNQMDALIQYAKRLHRTPQQALVHALVADMKKNNRIGIEWPEDGGPVVDVPVDPQP